MSKGENMVERCTKAASAKLDGDWAYRAYEGPDEVIHRLKREYRKRAEDTARAVIEALVAATPEMLQAMHEAMFTEPYDATNDAMLGAGFEAALRTALSQPNDEGEGK